MYKYVSIATADWCGHFKTPTYSAVVQNLITAYLLASIVCYKHYSVAKEFLKEFEFLHGHHLLKPCVANTSVQLVLSSVKLSVELVFMIGYGKECLGLCVRTISRDKKRPLSGYYNHRPP